MNDAFLGKGWSFPVRINEDGTFRLSEKEENIRQSIIIILKTIKGERFNHPEFGCGISEYVFSSINSSTLSMIKEDIKEILTRFEPRISVEEVDVSVEDESKLLISISYRILKTNRKDNLVYPFYIKGR
ncbi:GPW/gp25 family protein [Persephonella sp.]